MTLKDLVDKFNWDLIEARMLVLYPDQEKSLFGYKKALNELKKLSPLVKDNIKITCQEREDDGEKWIDVSGLQNKEFYGIEFTNWREWLSMEIESRTIKNFTELDILVYCLWEMTFNGFSNKEIQKEAKSLFSTCRKAMKDIEKNENII